MLTLPWLLRVGAGTTWHTCIVLSLVWRAAATCRPTRSRIRWSPSARRVLLCFWCTFFMVLLPEQMSESLEPFRKASTMSIWCIFLSFVARPSQGLAGALPQGKFRCGFGASFHGFVADRVIASLGPLCKAPVLSCHHHQCDIATRASLSAGVQGHLHFGGRPHGSQRRRGHRFGCVAEGCVSTDQGQLIYRSGLAVAQWPRHACAAGGSATWTVLQAWD